MNLKPLTSEERQGARERALAVMARQLGPEPTRRDFQHVCFWAHFLRFRPIVCSTWDRSFFQTPTLPYA